MDVVTRYVYVALESDSSILDMGCEITFGWKRTFNNPWNNTPKSATKRSFVINLLYLYRYKQESGTIAFRRFCRARSTGNTVFVQYGPLAIIQLAFSLIISR